MEKQSKLALPMTQAVKGIHICIHHAGPRCLCDWQTQGSLPHRMLFQLPPPARSVYMNMDFFLLESAFGNSLVIQPQTSSSPTSHHLCMLTRSCSRDHTWVYHRLLLCKGIKQKITASTGPVCPGSPGRLTSCSRRSLASPTVFFRGLFKTF